MFDDNVTTSDYLNFSEVSNTADGVFELETSDGLIYYQSVVVEEVEEDKLNDELQKIG